MAGLGKDCLNLNFTLTTTNLEVAVTSIIATGLKLVWDKRKEGKHTNPIDIKAEIEARKHTLLHSRYPWAGEIITTAILDYRR